MPPEILTILPNLSIGVISIGGLIYVVIKFLNALDQRVVSYESAMQEREAALRDVERSVRENLYTHITQSTLALQENTKVLARVINHLDSC